MSAEARAATAFVNAEAEEGWYTTPSIQDARAKDIAHRNMLRMAQSDPNTVMAVLLRDPEALVNEAQEIMHHEWEVAKKAPSVISPFIGKAHRLEPAEATQPTQPNNATQPKAAPLPPPPSWSASAQRQRREAKAAAQGRTLRAYTRTIVQADGDHTRAQLTNLETVAEATHNELMGAICKPPPAQKAKGASPAAPRPKLTATEKKAAAAQRNEKAAAKAKANVEYWTQKASSYQ